MCRGAQLADTGDPKEATRRFFDAVMNEPGAFDTSPAFMVG
jgi:hypothetical protein